MTKSTGLCLLLVLLIAPAVWSGQIDPYLQQRLDGLLVEEGVDVLVMMEHQADIPALNAQLRAERVTLAERNRRVIEALQEVASETQPTMVAYLDDLQAQGLVEQYRSTWLANMFIVRATRAGIEAIAARPDIADVYLNYQIEGYEPVKSQDGPPLVAGHEIGLERINAVAAWQAGFTGAGRVVANIDTGVDGNHNALSARFRGDVDQDGDVDESWYDPYAGWTFPQDSGSHGTHTMGTICGRSPVTYDTVGVAIDALWIAAAPIDRGGGIPRTVSDALLSFQWMVDPDGNPNTQDNPDAVGNSWGISPIYHGYPHCDQTFWVVIDNLEAAGTAVIFSAGNEGSYGANTLRTPADRETTPYNVFSVGSVNGYNPALPISDFSSRGPTYCTPGGTPAFKPEVVAPGESVRSSVPGNGYAQYDGTSMASPHITGSIAVIRGVNPDLDVETIKEILLSTATDLGPQGEDNDYGRGVINLYEACLAAASGYGFVEGHVYDPQASPIAGARVTVEGTSRLVITDDSGFYRLGMPGDTSYTFVARAFGFVPDTAVVAVIPDDTVTQDFTLQLAATGYLTGIVSDLDSNPIANATLTVVNTPLDPVYTDDSGRYLFTTIPGGDTYTIEATASGYGLGRADVFVPIGDTATLDFALQVMESFESNNGGWVGDGVWEWGVPTSGPGQAYDGNNVWATVLGGTYPNNADDSLITPLYSITDPGANFTFYHWFDMENSWDGGNVQVSTDGGATYTVLTPEGGYPDDQIVGLDNQPGYTNVSGDWVQAIFDLSTYQGQVIKLMYRFGTDGSVVRDGWYLDGVVISGGVAVLPEAQITPSRFSVVLMQGDSTVLPLTVTNAGGAPLSYSVVVLTEDLASATSQPVTIQPENPTDVFRSKEEVNAPEDESALKTESDPPFNHDVITDIGGPDAYGYTFIDSDEPGGPVYEWMDITGIGTPITFTHGTIDDGWTDLFPMGLSFEFYGQTYTEVMVSTNGWIAFQYYTSSYLTNYAIPTASLPNNFLPVQWDDLDGGTTGTCYYYYDSDLNKFIVSWVNWHYYPDATTPQHSFQVILSGNDKSVVYQYSDIEGTYQSDVSIGIENQDGTIGLQYAFNNSTVVPGLAIKFKYPLFWLTVTPRNGVVEPSQTAILDVGFYTAELAQGYHYGQILLNTNDPNHSLFTIPCTLRVDPVGISDNFGAVPREFSLAQNYPNPFNPITRISFGLAASGHTTLDVYDILGRRVRTLVSEELQAGTYHITWDSTDDTGKPVASGMYFYKLVQGDNVVTNKMLMLK